MRAETIAIGTELTTGAKLDTNSQWLSRTLGEVGIVVRFHQTMADDLPAIVTAFRTAADRSDLVVITGGLGPTADDLTRYALAELLGAELEIHEPSLAIIRQMFASRGRPMPERNSVQALFPRGSVPLPNPRGTAPGIWLELSRPDHERPCHFAALPGVPSEMKPMFFDEILPRLPGSGRVIRHARVHCFGAGESQVEEILGDLTARGRDPEVGITAHEATITLRIVAEGPTEEYCCERIAAASAVIQNRLGEMVFGVEDEEMQDVVVRRLCERGQTLSTAEAGTGGMLANLLTSAADFATVFVGGTVAPTDAAKTTLLGVPMELLQTHGSVSEQVAASMAEGCRLRCGSDYALAITEPSAATDGLAEQAWIALAGDGFMKTHRHVLVGDPGIARSRAAKTALNLLRLHLR